jgi:hypothetical protein
MQKMMSDLAFISFFGGQDLQSIVPATKTEPEASEVQHFPHGIIITFYIKNDNKFTIRDFRPFKTSSKFSKYRAYHEK